MFSCFVAHLQFSLYVSNSFTFRLPAKRPAPGPAPISPAQKITKPAAKYGVPLTVRRPPEALRKVPDAAKKPIKLKQVRAPNLMGIVKCHQFHWLIHFHGHTVCAYVSRGGKVFV